MSGNAMAQDNLRRKPVPDGIDYTEVNNYVHSRADEIVANIRAQVEYAGLRDTDLPGGIVIVGGGARLRGFNELLSQQTNMKVRQGAPTASVRITDGSIDRAEMVDVISILAAAARMPEAECLTPAVAQDGGRDSDGHDSYESRYGEGSVAGRGSRIGRLDDEDDDDEAAENEKKPVRRSEQPQKSRGVFSSFVTSLKEGIARMVDDNTEFKD